MAQVSLPCVPGMDSRANEHFHRALTPAICCHRWFNEASRNVPHTRVMSTIAVPTRARTAFVLAGGGSLGAAQVGMLRALVESGINADLVVGTSVGAINAAYFAGDPTPDGIARLAALWSGLKRTDILPLSWRGLFGLLRRRDHLVPSDGLRRLLDLHLPYRNLEDAALPVHVVATDILSGEAVVLSRGPATRAVLASSAIPAAFAPVQINGRLLCDGAIASNTPVRVAAARGARRLIVLPTGSACRLKRPPNGAIATALHAITLLTTRQLAAELNGLDTSAECHILPTEGALGGSPFNFSRTSELLERSYRGTLQWLDDGGLDRSVSRDIAALCRAREIESLANRDKIADLVDFHWTTPISVGAPQG
jgi:NTE family protein